MKFYTVYFEDEYACTGRKELGHFKRYSDAQKVFERVVNDLLVKREVIGNVPFRVNSPSKDRFLIHDIIDEFINEPTWEAEVVWIEKHELL